MAKTGYYNNETEKYTRRIPLNIAETWNTWCETYNSQYPDIHISKVDFASAAYLLFMKSSQKNIATSLKNISRSSKKNKASCGTGVPDSSGKMGFFLRSI